MTAPGRPVRSRVLVVDDDQALQRMMRMLLNEAGLDVEVAGDGIAGLELLDAQAFDLVLLDLQMPRMDGREMYHELRSRGYMLPVIVLSAYRPEAARQELNADGAISKPFDIDVLIDAVQSLLTSAPAGTSHGTSPPGG